MNFNPNETAAIQAQVRNLETNYDNLRGEMIGFRSEVKSAFDNILSKIDSKTTFNWQPIGIVISVLMAFGGALYFPIREAAVKHEAQLEALRGNHIPRVEHEARWKVEADREREQNERQSKLWDELRRQSNEFFYLKGQLHPLSKG